MITVKLNRNLRNKIERRETGETKRIGTVLKTSSFSMPRLENGDREQINPEEARTRLES